MFSHKDKEGDELSLLEEIYRGGLNSVATFILAVGAIQVLDTNPYGYVTILIGLVVYIVYIYSIKYLPSQKAPASKPTPEEKP